MIVDSNIILDNLFESSKEWRLLSCEQWAVREGKYLELYPSLSYTHGILPQIITTSFMIIWVEMDLDIVVRFNIQFFKRKTQAHSNCWAQFNIHVGLRNEWWQHFGRKEPKVFGHKWKYERNCSHESMCTNCGNLEGSPTSKHFYTIWSYYHFDCREIIMIQLFQHMEKMDIGQKMSIVYTTQCPYCY